MITTMISAASSSLVWVLLLMPLSAFSAAEPVTVACRPGWRGWPSR